MKQLKEPSKVLDELSDKSLAFGQTLSDWYDYLVDFRDELDMKIAATRSDIKNQDKTFEGE